MKKSLSNNRLSKKRKHRNQIMTNMNKNYMTIIKKSNEEKKGLKLAVIQEEVNGKSLKKTRKFYNIKM